MDRAIPSAINSAASYVSRYIRTARLKDGDRLPTVRAFATNIGVSPAIVSKALAIVNQRHDLTIRRGYGIILGSPRPACAPTARPGGPRGSHRRTEDAFRAFTRDILEGRFDAGQIPSIKECMKLYDVCYTTMMRILLRLLDDGILVRRKKRFLVRRPSSSIRGMDILMVISEAAYRSIDRWGLVRSWVLPLVRSLEQECVQRNLRLVIRPFSGDPVPLSGLENCAGAIVWLEPFFPQPEKTERLIRSLLDRGFPVIVYNEKQEDRFGDIPFVRNLFWESPGRVELAGLEVGRFLLGLGHRKVCFFDTEPGRPWMEERRLGIARAFEQAGVADGVMAAYADSGARQYSRKPAAGFHDLNDERGFLRAQLRSIDHRFASSIMHDRMIANIEECLHYCSGEWECFVPAFERVIASTNVTAWIAADDSIALLSMLPFLNSRKVQVPAGLSVVGFGNWIESTSRFLTTYDFVNMTATISILLDCILFPNNRKHYVDSATNEIAFGGVVIDRGSAGPPAQR